MNPSERATPGHGPGIPAEITTPDRVETRIGKLSFTDGLPSRDTLDRVYDNLDFTRAFDAFVNTIQAVSMHAFHRGFLDAGAQDNEVLIFSELMDAKSLFLTTNADTVHAGGFLKLTDVPVVFETPPAFLGAMNDYWYRWVIDLGAPGPDRGRGGKYLILPPGYDGPQPEGGFFVAHSRTTCVMWFGRLFLEDHSPKPADERARASLRIYPYQAGGVGTSFASFLGGEARLGAITPPPEVTFHDGSRHGDEHRPAQRLHLLRATRRDGAAEAGRLAGPRADGAHRRDRHRQRQPLRTRRPDEEDPH